MTLAELLAEVQSHTTEEFASIETRLVKLTSHASSIFAVSYTSTVAAVAVVEADAMKLYHDVPKCAKCQNSYDHTNLPVIWKLEDSITCCALLADRDERVVVLFGMDSGRVLSYEFEIKKLCYSSTCTCNKEFHTIEANVENIHAWDPICRNEFYNHDMTQEQRPHVEHEFNEKIFTSEISTIMPYEDYVLVSDRDGFVVKIPTRQCFISKQRNNPALPNMIKWGYVMEVSPNSDSNLRYLPIPPSQLSLLTPPPQFKNPSNSGSDFFEVVSYGGSSDNTLNFYSHQEEKVFDDSVFEFSNAAIDATKKVYRGALGAVRKLGWLSPAEEKIDNVKSDEQQNLTSYNDAPYKLIMNRAIIDTPRRIVSASVDPSGSTMATTDALGRIMLIDLSTRQVVRIWKGFRDAKCYWIQSLMNHSFPILYLLIHAEQRQFIEIYRLRHGGRVKHFSCMKDDKVLQCFDSSLHATCYLFNFENSQLSEINIDDDVDSQSMSTISISVSTDLNLRLLQQLLSKDTNLNVNSDKVLKAFTEIPSLKELSEALDLLASSTSLEARLNSKSSTFHSKLIEHAEQRVHEAMMDKGYISSHQSQINDTIVNIQFHKQIVEAYEVIECFQTDPADDNDENDSDIGSGSTWAAEAIGWLTTFEKISKKNTKSDLPNLKDFTFARFAKSCRKELKKDGFEADKKSQVYIKFCDSSRDRKVVLSQIFRSLISDIFVFNLTNTIFQKLGIIDDTNLLLQYFGEWFMSLETETILRSSFRGVWRPMFKWIQDLASKQICNNGDEVCLQTLFNFCKESEDLPRTFLLATLCRETISAASSQLEERSYGNISRHLQTRSWNHLLRKLRVCLLVSLRLHDQLTNELPITVANVESGKHFSIYQWLAMDELTISRRQNDDMMIERTAYTSSDSFDPSTEGGDIPSKWKLLQDFCVDSGRREGLNHVEDAPTLLLYFKKHNRAAFLAANRALLLGGMWGRQPHRLNILKAAVSAARAVSNVVEIPSGIVAAVRIELWQAYMRPIYRALFFGFEDVVEISADILAPLCSNSDWLRGLTNTAIDLLSLIEASQSTYINEENVYHYHFNESNLECWDLDYKGDILLQRLAAKTDSAQSSSINLHKGILHAFLLSDNDMDLASRCLPTADDIFLRKSISNDMLNSTSNQLIQLGFIEEIVLRKLRTFHGHTIDLSFIQKIQELGRIWGISANRIQTRFVLTLYRLGKDVIVDSSFLQSSQLDVSYFVKGGVEVVCVRLFLSIESLKKTRKYRHIISQLDADVLDWISDVANESMLLSEHQDLHSNPPSVAMTHEFLMKLNRLGFEDWNNEKVRYETEKVGALSSLCQSLMHLVRQSEHV